MFFPPLMHFLSKQRVNVKVVVAAIVAIVVLKQTFKSKFYCLHCCVFTEMVVIILSLEPKSYPQKWNQIYRLARGYVLFWVKLYTRLLFLFNFHTFKKLLLSSQQTTYYLQLVQCVFTYPQLFSAQCNLYSVDSISVLSLLESC